MNILETVDDAVGNYWASIHTPAGVLRLRISNPQMPSISTGVLQILTAEGEAATLWFQSKEERLELANFLEKIELRLRQNAAGAEIALG
jgi:hypothetical protein